MSNYTDRPEFFNPNPPEGHPRKQTWKTRFGYDYLAKILSHCLIANEKLQGSRYTWHATVNIHDLLTDAQHKAAWKATTRSLRQHITAFYIREPDAHHHVNYHVVVNTEISKGRLRECIETAFPRLNITFTIEPVYSTFALARYITKVAPDYTDRRAYFLPAVTLNKHGAIGPFWVRPQKGIWAAAIETEKRISAALDDCYDLTLAAKYLHWCCDGYIPFRRIRRRLALNYPGNKDDVSDLARCWLPEYTGA